MATRYFNVLQMNFYVLLLHRYLKIHQRSYRLLRPLVFLFFQGVAKRITTTVTIVAIINFIVFDIRNSFEIVFSLKSLAYFRYLRDFHCFLGLAEGFCVYQTSACFI